MQIIGANNNRQKYSQAVAASKYNSSGERLFVFEFLRAFACVLVVLEHVFLPTQTVEYLHYKWCFSFGGLGIGISTFISGYLIARSLETRRISEYAAQRFWRIFPPYFFRAFGEFFRFRVDGLFQTSTDDRGNSVWRNSTSTVHTGLI